MRSVRVAGVGLWTPGYASAGAWLEGRHEPAATRPTCAMLDSRIGRFTSLVTRMAVEALAQAAAHGGADLKEVPTLFGSAYGEIRTAFDQMDMIEREGLPSPARFKNSVHNTASGHVSIATGNMRFSTSLAAGSTTFAMCLLEAFAWLEVHRSSIIVSVADEPLPEHLAAAGCYDPLGIAFHLTANHQKAAAGLGELSNLRRQDCECSSTGIPERLMKNPCAAGLLLIEAVLRKRSGTVPVETGRGGWCVELRTSEGVASC